MPLKDWCLFSRAGTAYIDPGSPWQNPFVESFHSRLRDELLDVEEFSCPGEAKVVISDWREDYRSGRRRAHPGAPHTTGRAGPHPAVRVGLADQAAGAQARVCSAAASARDRAAAHDRGPVRWWPPGSSPI